MTRGNGKAIINRLVKKYSGELELRPHMVVDIMLHLTDLLLLFLQQRIVALLHFGGFQLYVLLPFG